MISKSANNLDKMVQTLREQELEAKAIRASYPGKN